MAVLEDLAVVPAGSSPEAGLEDPGAVPAESSRAAALGAAPARSGEARAPTNWAAVPAVGRLLPALGVSSPEVGRAGGPSRLAGSNRLAALGAGLPLRGLGASSPEEDLAGWKVPMRYPETGGSGRRLPVDPARAQRLDRDRRYPVRAGRRMPRIAARRPRAVRYSSTSLRLHGPIVARRADTRGGRAAPDHPVGSGDQSGSGIETPTGVPQVLR